MKRFKVLFYIGVGIILFPITLIALTVINFLNPPISVIESTPMLYYDTIPVKIPYYDTIPVRIPYYDTIRVNNIKKPDTIQKPDSI